jgi:hypothetical protein
VARACRDVRVLTLVVAARAQREKLGAAGLAAGSLDATVGSEFTLPGGLAVGRSAGKPGGPGTTALWGQEDEGAGGHQIPGRGSPNSPAGSAWGNVIEFCRSSFPEDPGP